MVNTGLTNQKPFRWMIHLQGYYQSFKLLENYSLIIRNLFIDYSYKIEIPMNKLRITFE